MGFNSPGDWGAGFPGAARRIKLPLRGALLVACGELERRRVYEVMSTPPVTVGVDASLIDAARAMYESNVGSVVVVDDNGGLAGIVLGEM